MSPSRYCDSLKELVVDDGIKTLGLRLCAACMVRGVALFDRITLGLHIIVYIGRLILPKEYNICVQVNPLR